MLQSAPLADSPALETQLLPKLIVRTVTHCAVQRLAAKTAGETLGSGRQAQFAAHVGDASCVGDLPDFDTDDEIAPPRQLPLVGADFASKSEEDHTSRGNIAQRSRPTTASTHWTSPSGSLPVIEEVDFEDDASSCASSELSEYGADEGTYAARLERSHFARIDTFDSLASILQRR
eukprot:TRINITY_DN2089_c0_g1_i11.p1 TRINITY_DN2089_c0_g1~~TRINITY_DN2089_c0_g1_i11.p1  ORF type:complete len:176 (-),score=16.28 TRINITY_DN2089_c0_g1_i11:386-913(-)